MSSWTKERTERFRRTMAAKRAAKKAKVPKDVVVTRIPLDAIPERPDKRISKAYATPTGAKMQLAFEIVQLLKSVLR